TDPPIDEPFEHEVANGACHPVSPSARIGRCASDQPCNCRSNLVPSPARACPSELPDLSRRIGASWSSRAPTADASRTAATPHAAGITPRPRRLLLRSHAPSRRCVLRCEGSKRRARSRIPFGASTSSSRQSTGGSVACRRGLLRVASPEATALELVGYADQSGGLD